MKATWITTKEAAELLGITDRSVQRNCITGKYQVKTKKSKKGREHFLIALSSLPEAAQKKYAGQEPKEEIKQDFSGLPDWAREKAIYRNTILTAWENFAAVKEDTPAGCVDDFIRESGGLYGRLTRSTLYRWKKALDKDGVPGLAPRWKNGRKPLSDETFSQEAKDFAEDVYCHQGRVSMKQVYYKTRKAGRRKGWNVPSYDTFRRFIGSIPKSVKILTREGKKAYEDRAMPIIFRDPSKLEPLEVVESDHHQVDVAVRLPDGRVVFPWVTAWMDVRTRKILAWSLVTRPNSDSINISLRELILRYGVPGCVHLDNGKDYRAKLFTGGIERFSYRMNVDETEGIYKALGTRVSWAIPYNAKSKTIERFFKTFRTEFSLYMRGYRGKDTKERPENLAKQIKNNNIHTLESLKEALYCYFEVVYNEERVHTGKGMGKRPPNAVFYQDGGPVKRVVSEAELSLLCSRHPRPKQVEQTGIWMNDFQDWYMPPIEIQHKYFGRKVQIRYVEDDISKLYLFDMAGRYLGTADKKGEADWGMDTEGYKKHMGYKKAVREADKSRLGRLDRMSDREREGLVVNPAAARNFKEPELKKKVPVITKFSLVIEEEKKQDKRKKEKRAQVDVAMDIMRRKYGSSGGSDDKRDDNVNIILKKYRKIGGNDD